MTDLLARAQVRRLELGLQAAETVARSAALASATATADAASAVAAADAATTAAEAAEAAVDVANSNIAATSWTYAKLTSDFVTLSAAAVTVPGLAFTPAAGKSYEFHAKLLCRTATATVGPRPGVNIPGDLTDMAYRVMQPSSKTATLFFHESARSGTVAVGGLPDTTNSYLTTIDGLCALGASPTGAVQVTLASETAGTNVTIKAGSFIRWRELPA